TTPAAATASAFPSSAEEGSFFPSPSTALLLHGVRACDVAVDESSPQAMLVAAATGFSAGIEARYRVALHVDDLRAPVDPKTTVRIVPDRIECGRVERRLFDLIHRRI